MYSYRDVQDDFYHPRILFSITVQGGREVAHGFPVPDQLGWLLSFPLVFLPLLTVALAYANGYYVTLGALWVAERIGVWLERLWRQELVDYWEEYVPIEYRERIEDAVPEMRIGEQMRKEEKERKLERLKEQREERGSGQTNVTKSSEGSRSFKDN